MAGRISMMGEKSYVYLDSAVTEFREMKPSLERAL